MRIVIFIFCIIAFENSYSQIDCRTSLVNYENNIDTSIRPVYAYVDTMPDILIGSNIFDFFATKMQLVDSSHCFPIYIYYGFVIESDYSISNIMVCPTLMFCDENEKIELIEKKYINNITQKLLNIKTNSGLLNGKKVAVYTKGRIHFDPQ